MNSIRFIFILFLLPVGLVFAQEPLPPGAPQFGAEGRLLILKVVPGDRTAKLFFIGKKAVTLDFQKDHKLLSVTAFNDGQKETLKFRSSGESYEVLNMPAWKEPYSLDVKSEVRGKVEELNVKIVPTKP